MEGFKKVLLVYNPKAGNGMFKSNLDRIISKFQAKGYIVTPLRTPEPELLDFAMSRIKDDPEYSRVIAAGGDGTINFVVNSMKRNGVELPLAIFPAGTANDFAFCFGIPNDIDSMINVALKDNFMKADIGMCNGKYFVNVAAMGSLVDLSQRTDPNVKNALGVVAYYLRGLGELHKFKPVPFKVECEQYNGTENLFFMLVMNGNSAGGFRKVGAQSAINDGVFDVMMFKDAPIYNLVPLAFDILQGRHDANSNVIYFQTDKIHIEAADNVGSDVDGEHGGRFPLDIEILPSAITVIVPESI